MPFHRHAAIYGVLHHSLTSACIAACLEPPGLSRFDGKWPDGLSLILRECGKSLVCDATVPDSLTKSYSLRAVFGTGAVAALTEFKKSVKNADLTSYIFTHQVTIECLGALGP
uniref:Uncharacterized protein n=1 Tax=Amphimedon queenslandica TaxID=400682 RepID=A0A1X7VRB7_AMPQE